MTPAKEDDSRWHLDKKVPIALILAILGQSCSTIWFVAKLDARVASLEDARVIQHITDDKQDKASGDAVALLRSDIHDIGAKLDRLIERERK